MPCRIRYVRCYFGERDENEGTLGEPGVGNHEIRFVDDLIAVEQEIQIQCTRSILDAAGAVAPELALDAEEFL